MSKHTRRVFRATMAAAGAATLGMSFVGTAAAAPTVDDQSETQPSYGSDSPGSLPSQDSGSPMVDNGLAYFEMPRLETTAFETPTHSVRASDDDSWGDDDDEFCGDDSGNDNDLGGYGEFQDPCQSRDNSFGEGEVGILGQDYPLHHGSYAAGPSNFRTASYATPISDDTSSAGSGPSSDQPAAGTPDLGGVVSQDGSQGSAEQDPPSLAPLAGHTQMNGYRMGDN